jgi:hypothetical protein
MEPSSAMLRQSLGFHPNSANVVMCGRVSPPHLIGLVGTVSPAWSKDFSQPPNPNYPRCGLLFRPESWDTDSRVLFADSSCLQRQILLQIVQILPRAPPAPPFTDFLLDTGCMLSLPALYSQDLLSLTASECWCRRAWWRTPLIPALRRQRQANF